MLVLQVVSAVLLTAATAAVLVAVIQSDLADRGRLSGATGGPRVATPEPAPPLRRAA
jgi:hypothetical protein